MTSPPKKFKIMIAEDDPEDQRLIQAAFDLIAHHFETTLCGTGEALLQHLLLPQPFPDLILLDLNLPGLGGKETLSEIRSRGIDVPVVILTHSSAHKDINSCYQLGANSYIIKPDSPEQLAEKFSDIAKYWKQPHDTTRARKVLLVEGQPHVRKLITDVFRMHHIDIDVAESGAEAVAKFISGNYRLVLIDYEMPIMGGIDAAKAIRELETDSSNRVAIVGISGIVDENDKSAHLEAGMNDAFKKPMRLDFYKMVIAKYLL